MGRSKWKGFFIQNTSYQKTKKKDKIEIINKNISVVPKLINKNYKVYTGKKFSKVTLIKDMIGHKIGEFIMTRAKYFFKSKKRQKKGKKKAK